MYGQGMVEALSYERHGNGSPLVFLHGLGSSRAQAQAAVQHVTCVERITLDAPGHGGSAEFEAPTNFGSFARVVVELLDRLEIERAVIGGISMGAGISLRIALDFPERVQRLVLVRPAWIDRPGRPHLDIVADIGNWIAADGIESARGQLAADKRHLSMLEHVPLAALSVEQAINAVAATGRPDVLHDMVDSQPVDDRSDLATISQRTLVISNEHDPLHPTEIANELATGISNSRLVLAPPRYLEPSAHQQLLTSAIDSFIAEGQG